MHGQQNVTKNLIAINSALCQWNVRIAEQEKTIREHGTRLRHAYNAYRLQKPGYLSSTPHPAPNRHCTDITITKYLTLFTNLYTLNPSNAELNPICHLLEWIRSHHILHVSRIRVNNIYIKQLLLSLPISDRCHTGGMIYDMIYDMIWYTLYLLTAVG